MHVLQCILLIDVFIMRFTLAKSLQIVKNAKFKLGQNKGCKGQQKI